MKMKIYKVQKLSAQKKKKIKISEWDAVSCKWKKKMSSYEIAIVQSLHALECIGRKIKFQTIFQPIQNAFNNAMHIVNQSNWD